MFRKSVIITLSFLLPVVCTLPTRIREDTAAQQDISDFSNSNKKNVFLPFRSAPERLIDLSFKDMDDTPEYDAVANHEDDIFYKFASLPLLQVEKSASKSRNGF